MFNRKQFVSVLGEMARGLMFSEGNTKVNVEHPKPMIKPHGYDDLMRKVEQKCCVGCC